MGNMSKVVEAAIAAAGHAEVTRLVERLGAHKGDSAEARKIVTEFVGEAMSGMPDLEQYLVSTQDENGDDKSLVVTAPTPEEAVAEWGRYFEDDDPSPDMKVFVVPPMATGTKAHEWGSEMVDVLAARAPAP